MSDSTQADAKRSIGSLIVAGFSYLPVLLRSTTQQAIAT